MDIIDLSRHAVTVAEMEAPLAASGREIRQGDTVLLHMATNERLLGKPGYLHNFPGLALGSVHRLANCGITDMEGLPKVDKLVGRGRFHFMGFPPKIRGGTASPIRAVAIFGDDTAP